jgi:ABC-type Fe3+-hydroxamate transport system substrate-binding protein
MKTFTDQLGNQIKIQFPPQRIISLVPSQTELLADLNLDNRVVGITKFCIHPELWLKSKTIVGGTKKFQFNVIESLKPDLIIGNKEENYLEGVDQLRSKFPVWMSDIVTLEDSFNMIRQVGELTNAESQALHISNQIRISFSELEKLPPLRALYLIWRNPWMGAGTGTFINELMIVAGFKNCLSNQSRYPELNQEDLTTLNPELILLSSEPYPFQQKHIEEIKAFCPTAKIILVDGEMFSWYGSRLKKFRAYLKSLTTTLS